MRNSVVIVLLVLSAGNLILSLGCYATKVYFVGFYCALTAMAGGAVAAYILLKGAR